MTVVGTAGHVDHGKSTLLQAITGRDPDRWEEEKRRGLTIDLGFVWATLPSGREVSFVDVPGHERFIKNMLAGIEAIDAALFVVAADEGWMPQSEEHLAVLDLLEVERAVVALTKVDIVDADLAELATLEVLEQLEGTTLEGSEVVPVSARTGQGLSEVLSALDRLLSDGPPGTEPRMWVDRRFTVAGAGTVVTGTLLGGPLAIGDSLIAYPERSPVRIRGLESHEQIRDSVEPHRRVAVNLTEAPESLGRGAMLGREGVWELTDRFTASLRLARYVDDLGERGAFQVHVGTVAMPARLRRLEDGVALTLERPLPLRYGDRFILRETGRRAVVAGGEVVDPGPPRRGAALRSSARIPTGLSPEEAAAALLDLRGSERVGRLLAHAGALPAEGRRFGDWMISSDELERLTGRAIEQVSAFHADNPLRPGVPAATLASRLDVDLSLATTLARESTRLETDGATVWRTGHTASLDPEQNEAWAKARADLERADMQPPLVPELPIDREVVHGLVRAGDLVRISADLVYLPEMAERLRETIAAMPAGFTVAEFRDVLGVSRKYAVPILEWADDQGMTRRQGDVRTPLERH